jgi:hypothetical protein
LKLIVVGDVAELEILADFAVESRNRLQFRRVDQLLGDSKKILIRIGLDLRAVSL